MLLLEMEEEMEGRMVEELVEEMVVEMEGMAGQMKGTLALLAAVFGGCACWKRKKEGR